MTERRTRHTMTIDTGVDGVHDPFYGISVTEPKPRCESCFPHRWVSHNDPTDIAFSIVVTAGGYEEYWPSDTWCGRCVNEMMRTEERWWHRDENPLDIVIGYWYDEGSVRLSEEVLKKAHADADAIWRAMKARARIPKEKRDD